MMLDLKLEDGPVRNLVFDIYRAGAETIVSEAH